MSMSAQPPPVTDLPPGFRAGRVLDPPWNRFSGRLSVLRVCAREMELICSQQINMEKYNDDFEKFLKENDGASEEDLINFAESLMYKYELY